MTAKIFAIMLAAAFLFFPGFTVQADAAPKAIEITYYYYSPCEGCPEGEALQRQLEHLISSVASRHEYVITIKNIFEEKALNEFQRLTESFMRDDFVPAAPLVRINSVFMFGIDDITEKTAGTVAAIKAGRGDIDGIVSSMSGVDANVSYFVYFYTSPCESCDKAAAFFQGLLTEYEANGSASILRIDRVDLSAAKNVPLVHYFYDKHQVPKDRRKAPAVFYEGGCLLGAAEIEAGMLDAIESGQALGWSDIAYEPKASAISAAIWLVPAGIALPLAAFLLIEFRRKRACL